MTLELKNADLNHQPDVPAPDSVGSCRPSPPPPRSESNTSWTAHAGRVGTKGDVIIRLDNTVKGQTQRDM